MEWIRTHATAAALAILAVLVAVPLSAAEDDNDGRVSLYLKAVDPNGGKLFFTWKQIDGPQQVRIAEPNAAKQVTEDGKNKWVSETFFVPTAPGIYKFEVVVKNENDEEAKKIITREVLPPAPAPVAVAGKDKTATVGQVVVISGMDSKVGPGRNITEWEWSVIQKPEKAKAIDAKKLKERQFDFKAEEPGVYQFELRVSDGKRWSDPSRMMVTVKPLSLPPVVEETGVDPKLELRNPPKVTPDKAKPVVKAVVPDGGSLKIGQSVVLDGSASAVDPKMKPEFMWRQESGPNGRTFTADQNKPFDKTRTDLKNYPVWKFTPTEPGEYSFVLEITAHGEDGKQVIKSEPVVYTVTGDGPKAPEDDPKPKSGKKPIAKIFLEKDTVEAGEMVKLDASASKGENLEYVWGPVPGKRYPRNWKGVKGPKVEFQADEEGDYTVQLTVTDGKESATDKITIHVGAANHPPTITLKRRYDAVTDEPVLIEAEVKDKEDDRFEVKWTCIDPSDLKIPDALAKNPTLKFVPRKPGNYMFKITVSDAKGRSDSATSLVVVKDAAAAGNRAPTAVLDGPKTAAIGEKVRVSGARSSDPEKKNLTFLWKQEPVEGGPKITSEAPGDKEKFWEFTPTDTGKYIISLIVSDGVQNSEPTLWEVEAVRDNQAPVAKIAQPESLKLEVGKPIDLDGGGSADPEGEKLKFLWKKTGGNADVELKHADSDIVTLLAKSAGNVTLSLVVNDGVRDSAPESIEFEVGKGKEAASAKKPVAVITGPETAKGGMVELSGAKSRAGEGLEITTYIWAQPADGGPRTGLEGNELRKRDIRFEAKKPGTYVLTLKVVDSDGQVSDVVSHKVEVKGTNRPPRAVASSDANGPVPPGKEVKLSARGSLDPEGGPLTYKWKQLTGEPVKLPEDSAEIVNISPKTPGEYEFELVVNDGDTDSQPAKVSVTVQQANSAPVAVISKIEPCEPGAKIVLDSSESKDKDGDKITEQTWKYISGPEQVKFPWRGAGRQKVEVTLPKEGEYVFELKVFDGKEWSEPVRASVKTRAGNSAPVAVIAEETLRSEENVETVLDGSGSNDPDKGPNALTFTWKQLEGARVELQQDGAQARFTPKKMGNYKFELRVSDGKAVSEPAVVAVSVLKAGSLPVAVPRAIPNPVKAAIKGAKNDPNILELNAMASTAGGENKKAPLTYTWKQIGGDDLKLKPADLAKGRVGVRIFVPGKYRFQLVVSDGQNTSQPAYIDVQVNENEGAAPAKNEEKDAKSDEGAFLPVEDDDAELVVAAKQGDGALLPPPRGAATFAMAASHEEVNIPSDGEKPALLKTLRELARSADADAEKTLVSALSSDDTDIRDEAARSLYQRGINSIPALIEVLEKGPEAARTKAQWALAELTQESISGAAEWKQWWAQQPAAKR
ncbi:MAG TPA: HEAT repeat domain-containing protein [Planctomycetota bacterium]|nr:HEAT repeat domain-containing protein [Planctomycetota bacterium]